VCAGQTGDAPFRPDQREDSHRQARPAESPRITGLKLCNARYGEGFKIEQHHLQKSSGDQHVKGVKIFPETEQPRVRQPGLMQAAPGAQGQEESGDKQGSGSQHESVLP
jgi:hypothetical protein